MKYSFVGLTMMVVILFTSCNSCNLTKNQEEEQTATIDETAMIKEELEAREDFVSDSSIFFTDTTETYFKNIDIKKDILYEDISNSVFDFYKQNNFSSRWLYQERATELFDSYLEVLDSSKNYGFNPDTYAYSKLKESVKKLYATKPKTDDIAKLDKRITASFMLFATHISNGRITQPVAEKHIWRTYQDNVDKVMLLLKITDKEDLVKTIEVLHPNNEYYKKLREKLAEINAKTEESYHQFKINLSDFKIGYKNNNIKLLRENLEKRGYTFVQDSIQNTVDAELIEVIKRFQREQNLTDDGRPGRTTLKYLNITNREMKRLLILNMERLRWLNKDFGKEYLTVNIPQYKLFAINDDKIELEMRVIVGSDYTPTPIFIDSIAYIEFRPTWTVPRSIIRKEMIPKMAKDATYYTRKGFVITENGKQINPETVNWSDKSVYRRNFVFVEQPSKTNALGLVKFIFPNNLNIYLHDTPTAYLFKRDDRALSHGCIRLSEPEKLATYLLRKNEKWNSEKVKQAMQSGKPKNRVYLKEKVLVQLLYLTAIVIDDKVVISNDIYNLDKYQLEILDKDYGLL